MEKTYLKLISLLAAVMLTGCGADVPQPPDMADEEIAALKSNINYSCGIDDEGQYIGIDLDKMVTIPDNIEEMQMDNLEVPDDKTLWKSDYEMLLSQYGTSNGTKNEIEDGDIVNLSFFGKIDGKTFKGGCGDNVTINFNSFTMPLKFMENLIGHKANEEFEIKVELQNGTEVIFDGDTEPSDVSGQIAIYDVTIHEITDFSIKDEVFQSLPEMILEDGTLVTNEDTYKRYVGRKNQLDIIRQKVPEKIIRLSTMKEIPETVISAFIENEKNTALINSQIAGYTDFKKYLKANGHKNEKEYEQHLKKVVNETISRNAIILKAAKDLNISFDKKYCNDVFGMDYENAVAQYGVGYVKQNTIIFQAIKDLAHKITIVPYTVENEREISFAPQVQPNI